MAISVGAPYNYSLDSQAGAHAFMQALNTRLLAVGLIRATTGSDYDVNGAATQMPTTALATSAWMAYDFTDAVQSTFPITVWFRMVYGYTCSTASTSLRYVVQYRVSEGQSSGAALGADLQCYTGVGTTAAGGAAYGTTYANSIGDFVRYDGNSLTVIMGANGITAAYNSHNSSLLELHIERRYSVSTGLVGRGFTGWVPACDPGVSSPAQYAAGGYSFAGGTNPSLRTTPYVSSNEGANIFYTEAYMRSTSTALLTSSGAALAAPVLFMDPAHRPTPAMKLFTVPIASFTQGIVYTMDFLGDERPYLIYRPYSTSLKASVLAYAIEWET